MLDVATSVAGTNIFCSKTIEINKSFLLSK